MNYFEINTHCLYVGALFISIGAEPVHIHFASDHFGADKVCTIWTFALIFEIIFEFESTVCL